MSGFDRVHAAVLVSLLVLPCGACRHGWIFRGHDEPTKPSPLAGTPPPLAAGQSTQLADNRPPVQPPGFNLGNPPALGNSPSVPGSPFIAGGPAEPGSVQPVGTAGYRTPGEPGPQPSPLEGTTFAAGGGEWAGVPAEGMPGPALDPPGGPVFDPFPPGAPEAPLAAEPRSRLGAIWQEARHTVQSDYQQYYVCSTLRDVALGLAVAAPLANTAVDQHFRDWYQRDVRTSGTDSLASFWRPLGNGYIFVPAFAGLAVAGRCFEDRPVFGPVGDFSGQVTRAYLVGAPPMLLLQFGLGASRPGVSSNGSHWSPFHDSHGVSGHAFVGSVPFIAAANMVENPWAKGTLYALSTFTAWSRVNDDAHYLSQACLGWWMGYLACRAVSATQQEDKRLALTPIATPEMVGMGLLYRR